MKMSIFLKFITISIFGINAYCSNPSCNNRQVRNYNSSNTLLSDYNVPATRNKRANRFEIQDELVNTSRNRRVNNRSDRYNNNQTSYVRPRRGLNWANNNPVLSSNKETSNERINGANRSETQSELVNNSRNRRVNENILLETQNARRNRFETQNRQVNRLLDSQNKRLLYTSSRRRLNTLGNSNGLSNNREINNKRTNSTNNNYEKINSIELNYDNFIECNKFIADSMKTPHSPVRRAIKNSSLYNRINNTNRKVQNPILCLITNKSDLNNKILADNKLVQNVIKSMQQIQENINKLRSNKEINKADLLELYDIAKNINNGIFSKEDYTKLVRYNLIKDSSISSEENKQNINQSIEQEADLGVNHNTNQVIDNQNSDPAINANNTSEQERQDSNTAVITNNTLEQERQNINQNIEQEADLGVNHNTNQVIDNQNSDPAINTNNTSEEDRQDLNSNQSVNQDIKQEDENKEISEEQLLDLLKDEDVSICKCRNGDLYKLTWKEFDGTHYTKVTAKLLSTVIYNILYKSYTDIKNEKDPFRKLEKAHSFLKLVLNPNRLKCILLRSDYTELHFINLIANDLIELSKDHAITRVNGTDIVQGIDKLNTTIGPWNVGFISGLNFEINFSENIEQEKKDFSEYYLKLFENNTLAYHCIDTSLLNKCSQIIERYIKKYKTKLNNEKNEHLNKCSVCMEKLKLFFDMNIRYVKEYYEKIQSNLNELWFVSYCNQLNKEIDINTYENKNNIMKFIDKYIMSNDGLKYILNFNGKYLKIIINILTGDKFKNIIDKYIEYKKNYYKQPHNDILDRISHLSSLLLENTNAFRSNTQALRNSIEYLEEKKIELQEEIKKINNQFDTNIDVFIKQNNNNETLANKLLEYNKLYKNEITKYLEKELLPNFEINVPRFNSKRIYF